MSGARRHEVCRGTYRHSVQGGFTLIEVLVAALVIGIGLTGMAAMMAISLKANDSGFLRSQATVLAYDMVDRMRANRGSPSQGSTALGGAYDDTTLCKSSGVGDVRSCAAASTGSTVAAVDLRDWRIALDSSELPSWTAGIVRSATLVTVLVQWDDTRAKGRWQEGGTRASCLDSAVQVANSIEQVCVTTQL